MYNIRTMNENILPTMTDEERNEFLEIINTDVEKPMSLLDGFEDCLLYYMEDEDGNPHAVYCYEDLVESFARTSAPIIIHRINRLFTTLEDSFYEKQYSDD